MSISKRHAQRVDATTDQRVLLFFARSNTNSYLSLAFLPRYVFASFLFTSSSFAWSIGSLRFVFVFFSLFFPPQRKRRTDNARLRYRSSDDVLRLILIPLPRLTLSPSLSLFSSANNSNASRKKSPLAKTKRRPECPRSSKRLA